MTTTKRDYETIARVIGSNWPPDAEDVWYNRGYRRAVIALREALSLCGTFDDDAFMYVVDKHRKST